MSCEELTGEDLTESLKKGICSPLLPNMMMSQTPFARLYSVTSSKLCVCVGGGGVSPKLSCELTGIPH